MASAVVFLAVTVFVSIYFSRDHEIYINIISGQEKTDVLFDAYVEWSHWIGLDAESAYGLYVAFVAAILLFFFIRRKISLYWIAVYLLNFYLLHPVTQIRVAGASVLIALFVSSSRRWVRAFTLITPLFHTSAGMYAALGLSRNSRALAVVLLTIPLAVPFVYEPATERIARYLADSNETRALPFILIEYLFFLGLIATSQCTPYAKVTMLWSAVVTIALYSAFIEVKAISSRSLELSFSVLVLYAGSLDSSTKLWPATRGLAKYAYALILTLSVLNFYVQAVRNSVLLE